MREEHTQECPLCGRPAHFVLVDYNNRKYFRCPNCNYFQISRRAEQRVAGAPKEWLEQLSESSRNAPEGYALLIRVPSASPENANIAIEAKYMPRADLPD